MDSRPYKGSMSSGKASSEGMPHIGFEVMSEKALPSNNHGVSQATMGNAPKQMTKLGGEKVSVDTNYSKVGQPKI